jgi:hypothetical protein
MKIYNNFESKLGTIHVKKYVKKTPSTISTIKDELMQLALHPQNATFPMDSIIIKIMLKVIGFGDLHILQ